MIINVVGDVTGFAETLKKLYADLPEGQFWGLGDLIDRGPNSKGVLDFFMQGGHKSVMGNHDHMMLFEKIRNDKNVHHRLYHPLDWSSNGGNETAQSFGAAGVWDLNLALIDDYFKFIETMPLVHREGALQLTHAPFNDTKNKRATNISEINRDPILLTRSILWNRHPPTKQHGVFQVYGHNSSRGILWHTDKNPNGIYMADPFEVPEGAWAVCVDTWASQYLSALSIDTDKLDNPKEAITVYRKKIEEDSDLFTPKKVKQGGGYSG